MVSAIVTSVMRGTKETSEPKVSGPEMRGNASSPCGATLKADNA